MRAKEKFGVDFRGASLVAFFGQPLSPGHRIWIDLIEARRFP